MAREHFILPQEGYPKYKAKMKSLESSFAKGQRVKFKPRPAATGQIVGNGFGRGQWMVQWDSGPVTSADESNLEKESG